MNKLLLTLLVLVGISISCNGQPTSEWRVEWDRTEPIVKLFVWDGVDTTACPFIIGQDYKSPSIEAYAIPNVSGTSHTLTLVNDGEYAIVAGIVMNAQGVYSVLTKSYAVNKGTIPLPLGFIKMFRL